MTAHRVGLPCIESQYPLRRITLSFKLCTTWPDPNPFPRMSLWRGWRKR